MFGQMYGALDPAEVTRLSGLRQPNQEAVLGMWSPLLDLAPEELGALVKKIAVLPPGTPYLSLHGLDAGLGYAAWLTALIPSATIEVWDEVPTHYPHLVAQNEILCETTGPAAVSTAVDSHPPPGPA